MLPQAQENFPDFIESDPVPPASAVHVTLFLAKQPATNNDIERLTLVVTNVSDHPISYVVYEGAVPESLNLYVDDAPNAQYLSGWDGEPPHQTVTLAPGKSDSYHPLNPQTQFLFSTKAGMPRFQPGRKIYHVHAEWLGHSTDKVEARLD
jgi:hypothetical protein